MTTALRKQVDVAIAVVFDRSRERLLICRRKADVVLGGYWEFPGGKCEEGEPAAACALREVMEETGLKVQVVRELEVIEHDYVHARVRLFPFLCEWVGGDLQWLEVDEAKWIEPRVVGEYRFPEANAGLVRAVAGGYARLAGRD